MRDRGQTGASLVVVLSLIAFLGLMVPAVLALVTAGTEVTRPVVADRRELYAASSAIDAAVELGRSNPDVGVPGGPCPDQVLEIDALEVTVLCQQHAFPDDGCLYLDRFVNYTAEVRSPGDSAVMARTAAEVVYRFDIDGPPAVEVRQWTPNGDRPVSTLPLPPCQPGATTTTTTSVVPPPSTTTTTTTAPPTTTTTTTAVPTGATRSRWTATARESQGNDWRAVATLEVVSTSGAPVDGATVTVRPEYRVSGSSTWVTAADIVGTTNATGASTFHSAYYRRTGGSRITEVRFTVAGVATPQGLPWDNLASEPLTVVVALN